MDLEGIKMGHAVDLDAATGTVDADLSIVGMLSTRVMEQAVIRAVKRATPLHGLKCYRDLK